LALYGETVASCNEDVNSEWNCSRLPIVGMEEMTVVERGGEGKLWDSANSSQRDAGYKTEKCGCLCIGNELRETGLKLGKQSEKWFVDRIDRLLNETKRERERERET
jgi:hypothetical protein